MSGSVGTKYGTRENPLIINSESEWNNLYQSRSIYNLHITLSNNLTFSSNLDSVSGEILNSTPLSSSNTFNPLIESPDGIYFTGVFNGGFYSLNNPQFKFASASTLHEGGVFGSSFGGTIKNLEVNDVKFDTSSYGGVLLAKNVGTTLENIKLSNLTMSSYRGDSGLVFGDVGVGVNVNNLLVESSEMTITQDYSWNSGGVGANSRDSHFQDINLQDITFYNMTNYGGGVIGKTYGNSQYRQINIENLNIYPTTSSVVLGGVVGATNNGGFFKDIYVHGSITGDSRYNAGVQSYNQKGESHIENVFVEFDITGNIYCSGLHSISSTTSNTYISGAFFNGSINCTGGIYDQGLILGGYGYLKNNFWSDDEDDSVSSCYSSSYGGDVYPCLEISDDLGIDDVTKFYDDYMFETAPTSESSGATNGAGFSSDTWFYDGVNKPRVKGF